MSVSGWMRKETAASVCRGILLGHRKGNLAICHNLDRPRNIMLREMSQNEKDKYSLFHLYAESKNKNQKTKLIDTENRLGLPEAGVGGWQEE